VLISIVNHTNGKVTDEELQTVIRALNRQIEEDFAPYWGMSATLRLQGRSVSEPETSQLADMRGDAVIYLWDEADVEDALGYHFQNNRGVPFGFVFTEIAKEIGEDWSVTLSHEALELIADPETNLLVMGPHPDPSEKRDVFHWFEMCDAVQSESYEIDRIKVSNFVLPLYFTGTRKDDEVGARNDFLGRVHNGETLRSFSISPGGYIGFYDPQLENSDTYSLRDDRLARRRFEGKLKAKEARRAVRYRSAEIRERLQQRAESAGGRRRAMPEPEPLAVVSLTMPEPTSASQPKSKEPTLAPRGGRTRPVKAKGSSRGGRRGGGSRLR
jgi:hypothetical protein